MLVGDEVVERICVLVLSELMEIVEVKSAVPGVVERLEGELLGVGTRIVNGPATLVPVMPVVVVETSPDEILAAPVLASMVGAEVELSLDIIRNDMIDMI